MMAMGIEAWRGAAVGWFEAMEAQVAAVAEARARARAQWRAGLAFWAGLNPMLAPVAAWAEAMRQQRPKFDATGDIYVRVTFTPPSHHGDRINYYNRCKPLFDGLADALKVNDKRFVPVIDADSFQEPCKPGCVLVEVWQ